MENIILYILIGALVLVALGFAIFKIVKIIKMSEEEKRQLLKTYLKGLIALAEKEFSEEGKGAEKLEAVQKYFEKEAPVFLKIVLRIVKKDSLKDLIEEALQELKDSFKD